MTDTATKQRDSQETCNTKYKNMRKWMVEFLRKFENRSIKIARVNSILITKSMDLQLFTFLFTLILCGIGGPLILMLTYLLN